MAVVAALLLCLPLPAAAQNNAPASYPQNSGSSSGPGQLQPAKQLTARLSDVHGDVRVYRGALLAFPKAFVNMPLVEGMRIVAGQSGRAEIQFADGTVARLAPNSSLLLAHLSGANDGILSTRIKVLSGLTYYEFNGQGNQYTLAVGPETIVPAGSAVIRVDMDKAPYQVADMQGGLQVLNGNDLLVSLQLGQNVSLNPSNPSMYHLSDSIPPNS